ncbi:c-type cytochrome [Brevundimonas sp.]|uniref:c-type cytochrome n=1 Tax=Brevundimonas sp. TaxID=1871086 RepID=UPI002FC92267
MTRVLLLMASAALLTSCGESEPAPAAPAPSTAGPASPASTTTPTPAAAAPGAISDADAQLTLATLSPPYNTADLANGRAAFARCRSCHTLAEGGARLTGPNLWGLFGRQVGSMEGYTYSRAVQDADFVWGPDNLDHWLDNPKEFLPGNKMTFAGLHDAEDRRDLIAYIATQTRRPPTA